MRSIGAGRLQNNTIMEYYCSSVQITNNGFVNDKESKTPLHFSIHHMHALNGLLGSSFKVYKMGKTALS